MRYVPESMLYVEPCPWCGVDVGYNGWRTVEADGYPHTCPPPQRHVPGERDFPGVARPQRDRPSGRTARPQRVSAREVTL